MKSQSWADAVMDWIMDGTPITDNKWFPEIPLPDKLHNEKTDK